jgi:MFS family permease
MKAEEAETRVSEPSPPAQAGFLRRQFPLFTSRQRRVFWISTTAGFFDNYDGALLSLALKQIQQGLAIAEANLGAMLSLIRLGYLGSILIAPLADVFGRRRLLLYTIVGYTIFTALSAVAPTRLSFVTAQTLARAFSGAEATISLVILAEEIDAASRGAAIGLQGALAITGYGLAAIVFGFITIVPYGWRGLYAIAVLPLLLIMPLRRILPESRRFEAEAELGVTARHALQPVITILQAYPARIAIVFAVWALFAMGAAPGGIFIPKYLQEVHRWSPAQVSELFVFGGLIGIIGNVVAGRVSDRLGRRTIGVAFLFSGAVFELALYSTGGRALVVVWILWLFCDQAASTILNAYGAELFPTAQRSAAGGLLTIAHYGGGALGLLAEGWLYNFAGGHWNAIRMLLVFFFASAFLMMVGFPETAGRELEEIAPETVAR